MKEMIYKNKEVSVTYQIIFSSRGGVNYIGVMVRRLDELASPWIVYRDLRPSPFERCDFEFQYPVADEKSDEYRRRIAGMFAVGIMDNTRCSEQAAADAAGAVCCALDGYINTRYYLSNSEALPYGGRGFGLNF